MEKISIADYYRVSRKECKEICNIKVGDLIKVDSNLDSRKNIIAIVTDVYDNKMCLLLNNKKEWWSRYVKCDNLTYNN